MKITIIDKVGFSAKTNLNLVSSLLENRKPREGSFNYKLETHGAIDTTFGIDLPYPIQVYQSNKRKTDKSPIVITIERHHKLT
jgi:hypothetical protein